MSSVMTSNPRAADGVLPVESPGPATGYAICTSPRSGSNLLCQWLTSTGKLGRPLEYFNGPSRRALGIPDFPDDPELQLKAVLERARTPNGVYGLKLFPVHADMAERARWPTRLPRLAAPFPGSVQRGRDRRHLGAAPWRPSPAAVR